jgi:hypothetical protein
MWRFQVAELCALVDGSRCMFTVYTCLPMRFFYLTLLPRWFVRIGVVSYHHSFACSKFTWWRFVWIIDCWSGDWRWFDVIEYYTQFAPKHHLGRTGFRCGVRWCAMSEKIWWDCCFQIYCVLIENFVIRPFLKFLTPFSAKSLNFGWYYCVNMCLMLFIFVKILNVSDVSWEPLSLTMHSGISNLAKHSLSLVIVDELVMLFMMYTSGHFKKESMTSRNILFMKGPRKMMCTRSHTLLLLGHARST